MALEPTRDERILQAARDVFLADPEAPVAAVAARAGVGISALYRRFESKEDLVRRVAGDGLARYVAAAEAAMADDRDPWVAFVTFVRRLVDAETHVLATRLAGTFTPAPEQVATARRAAELNAAIVERTRRAGALRPDVDAGDLPLLLEAVMAIRLGDAARTRQLRERYLALLLDALRAPAGTVLPGEPPGWEELSARWIPRAGG